MILSGTGTKHLVIGRTEEAGSNEYNNNNTNTNYDIIAIRIIIVVIIINTTTIMIIIPIIIIQLIMIMLIGRTEEAGSIATRTVLQFISHWSGSIAGRTTSRGI